MEEAHLLCKKHKEERIKKDAMQMSIHGIDPLENAEYKEYLSRFNENRKIKVNEQDEKDFMNGISQILNGNIKGKPIGTK